jgi:hypothetical protein
MHEDNQPISQDVDERQTHESADIEQEQGYSEAQPGLGRANKAGEVNELQPAWRPGEEAAGQHSRYSGEDEPGRAQQDRTGDDDDILSSRGDDSGAGGL